MISKPTITTLTAFMKPSTGYTAVELANLTGLEVRTVSRLMSSGLVSRKIEKHIANTQPLIVYLFGTAPPAATTRVPNTLAFSGEIDYAAWGKRYANLRALRESIKR